MTHVWVQVILVHLFVFCIRSCLSGCLFGLDGLFRSLLLTALELAGDMVESYRYQ